MTRWRVTSQAPLSTKVRLSRPSNSQQFLPQPPTTTTPHLSILPYLAMSSSIKGTSAVKSRDDLPPERDRRGVRPVSPPLSNVSFHRFNYYLALIAALLLAFYAWRLTIWKAQAGGWWNLMTGKQAPAFRNNGGGAGSGTGSMFTQAHTGGSGNDLTVEERINELASALGMPSKDLASAIAVAVHEYVPPATMSSIASHQTG